MNCDNSHSVVAQSKNTKYVKRRFQLTYPDVEVLPNSRTATKRLVPLTQI